MNKGNILVVEDERIISLEIRLILQKLGYTVIDILPTGEEALDKVLKNEPDLILMDIMLDGAMDGIETVEKIRKRSNVPVIYMTAYSDTKTRRRAAATNPIHFLVKPIPMKILEELLPDILYNRV